MRKGITAHLPTHLLYSPLMNIHVHSDPNQATLATADWLIRVLEKPATRNVMVAGGNTPSALYAEVAKRGPHLSHLNIFALDEFIGVPPEEPRNCANLLRQSVVEAWNIPAAQYHWLPSTEGGAERAISDHEEKVGAAGGLDLVILGLGRNGHIGFNEPGSSADCTGRIVQLDETSIAANREWFRGQHAPRRGVTTGLKTLLAAKSVLILAFGSAKTQAVAGMLAGPQSPACPASFFQRHPNARFVLDAAAASGLKKKH